MTVYFIGGLKFDNADAIAFYNRPYKTIEEMQQDIVEGINSVVSPQDKLYIIDGDDSSKNVVSKLDCKEVILVGRGQYKEVTVKDINLIVASSKSDLFNMSIDKVSNGIIVYSETMDVPMFQNTRYYPKIITGVNVTWDYYFEPVSFYDIVRAIRLN